ncbi:MAG: penicillin-binding transpeptidase domain-containing protein [Acidithiobacillus sp.]
MNRPKKMLPVGRARLVITVLLLAFAAMLLRDILLQVIDQSNLRQQGQMRYLRTVALPAGRGIITARNGVPLAVNVHAVTVWADPARLDKYRKQWTTLAHVLGWSKARFAQHVDSGGAEYAYIARQIAPTVGQAIQKLNVPGIYIQNTSRTYYPMGAVTTPLLGLVDEAHQGSAGLERGYNSWLAAQPGKELALIDGHGQVLHIAKVERLAHFGHRLHLTINPQIQYWAYITLARSLRHFHARDGSAVVMNVHTGQILAMVSAPSCNPNAHGACANPADYTNNAVHQAFEPGSVMKPFVVAAALASHSVSPQARFNVFHPLMVDGYAITDDVRHHILNIEHILKYSSCIGAAKIALKTTKQRIYDMYHAAGFGRKPDLGFVDATSGILPDWQGWSLARHATIALGYGVSVTTLQLADAYAAFANGGYHLRPELIMGQPTVAKRIMPTGVARKLQLWLQSVAEPNGTGILAAIPGYHVAGKTGTANMANGRGGFYHHTTNATFVGFAPGNHPQLVMAVSLRGSHTQWNFGGVESAPVFRVTMRHALQEMDITPACHHGKTMRIVVKPGDNLAEIAAQYQTTLSHLMHMNALKNPEDIDSGALLKVPAPANEKNLCRFEAPLVTRAQAEIWSEGGGQ